MKAATFGLYALGAVPAMAAPAQEAGCTREKLQAAADAYISSQTEGTGGLPFAGADTEYTENFASADMASGILSEALPIDHSRSSLDTTQCATYTELIVAGGDHPCVLGTQMWFSEDGSAVEKVETLISDEGDWLFDAAATLRYAEGESWDEIPEGERDDREVLQAAADAYADIFDDKSVVVPWGTPCARLEGGAYTGRGSPTDSCAVGIPDGVKNTNRRYVIDEVYGACDIFMTFAERLPDSHEFRVENGKLRYVHTITIMDP